MAKASPQRQRTCPILALPPELHLLIAASLIFPDLLRLKHTCRYFNQLIPPLTHAQLIQAENTDYAITTGIYACRYCLRLRPASQFADRMMRRRRGRFGRDACKRFCVDCGMQPRNGEARYGPGAQLGIRGVSLVICIACRELKVCGRDRWGRGTAYCVGCLEKQK
ncbi:hypothetical protein FE257_003547 [Aspergillus nanangensis]|uniref:F-box domain-containing protein n=1 Tax=Aspergillus nanangensis TaxID=2582783 RepID=A0AAD4CBG1_ASPNN|nr:hypothetical protein FE257_003547 [Aspergillus nanangensis]